MKSLHKITFGCYCIISIFLALAGLRYLFADQIMPYHLAAMGKNWNELSTGMQIMSLNFMKSAGVGFLSTAIASTVLLAIPFRKGQLWSNWAIAVLFLNQLGLIMSRVINVKMNTPANPPLMLFVALIGLTLTGFLFSLAAQRSGGK